MLGGWGGKEHSGNTGLGEGDTCSAAGSSVTHHGGTVSGENGTEMRGGSPAELRDTGQTLCGVETSRRKGFKVFQKEMQNHGQITRVFVKYLHSRPKYIGGSWKDCFTITT